MTDSDIRAFKTRRSTKEYREPEQALEPEFSEHPERSLALVFDFLGWVRACFFASPPTHSCHHGSVHFRRAPLVQPRFTMTIMLAC